MENNTICFVCADLNAPASIRKLKSFTETATKKGFSVVGVWPGFYWQAEESRWKLDFLRVFSAQTFGAVIVDAEGFEDVKTLKNQAKIAKKYNLPFFVLDMEVPGAINVLYDDKTVFHETFRHLKEEHNCKKIFFAGDLGQPYASARSLECYKEALENAGEIFDEKCTGYCNANIASGLEELSVRIHAAKPDGVICSHPNVANAVIMAAKRMGYRVPEDMVVSAVNAIKGRRSGIPDVTGGRRDFSRMSAMMVKLLEKAMKNQNVTGVYEVPMEFKLSESCGCGKSGVRNEKDFMQSIIVQRDVAIAQERKQNTLLDHFFKCKKIEELSIPIRSILPDDVFFCIRDSFVQAPESASRSVDNHEQFHIFAHQKTQYVGQAFNRDKLHEVAEYQRKKGEPVILYPVFIREGSFGLVVSMSDDFLNKQMMMARFMINLSRCFFLLVKSMESTKRYEELQIVNENLRSVAVRDPMTGMYNNSGLIQELEKIRQQCIRNGENLQLVSIDLDHLGNINDIYGHTEGDSAIIDLAQLIKESAATNDICAHLGGDEFMVVMHHVGNDLNYVNTFTSILMGNISNYNNSNDKEYTLNINTGTMLAVVYDDTDMTKLIDNALANKRLIKNNRRNSFHIGTEELSDDEKKLEPVMKDIIDNNRFRYAYQPIISAEDGSIFGYEALMRTMTEKPISPLTMIKYATINRRLYDIERATFFNIFEDIEKKGSVFDGRKIFVNSIPGYQIDKPDFEKLKKRFPGMLKNIIVEVTEQSEQNDEELRILTSRSVAEGFSIAIDDYGSGYSNTSTLLRYSPNCVKLDRLLISDLHTDPRKQHFVKNIIDFAHDNNFLALAEGVETSEELKAAITLGVDLIQGFYLAKPNMEVVEELPEKFINEIKEYHAKPEEKPFSKLFVLSRERELSVTRLALEMYTDVLVSSQKVILYGNLDYPAAIKVKIKDNSDATITLRNVILDNMSDETGIEIGENSVLHLILEGDNYIYSNGIRVPDSSTLKITGNGNLTIQTKNERPFGIGNDMKSAFGNILTDISGNLTVSVDGERSVGIGGYLAGDGARILLKGGDNKITSASTAFVGVGSFSGKADIEIFENHMAIEYRVVSGLALGSITGNTRIRIANCFVEITGDGKSTTAIGSTTNSEGKVEIVAARLAVNMNASRVMMIGSPLGHIRTYIEHSKVDLTGSGERVLGIGNSDMGGELIVRSAGLNIKIISDDGIPFGIKPENLDLGDTEPEVEVIRQKKKADSGEQADMPPVFVEFAGELPPGMAGGPPPGVPGGPPEGKG